MKLKSLILDIETSPLVVLVWDIKDQYITHNQILKDWDIMSWSAKWLDAPESATIYYDRRNSLTDKQILKPLWKLLNEADIVITQNGKKFDARKINARFIQHGFTPPSPYQHIDTFLITKAVAAFTSHSLDYMTDKLNDKYKKLSHGKYPGMELWKQCLSLKVVERPWKNPDAWDAMKEYNNHDVYSTEEMFNKVKPWGPKNTPAIYNTVTKCPMCESATQCRGYNKTRTKKRLHCKNPLCGTWSMAAIPKEKKAA